VTQQVEALAPHHDLAQLDSGAPELDRWLAGPARQSHDRDTARVYVICDTSGVVLAYSALVAATLGRESLSSRAASGLPQNIPAVLLGKLAVARSHHGAGLGTALLAHAIRTALEVRRLIGVRLLFAEARDQAARDWYVSKGMTCASDGRTCYARLKDFV
jgi:GNAT superfamily N-acetyltransferase